MDVYEALYTTRAMRRTKTDPVPLDVQAKILDAAIRAPTGGNMQRWAFMLVDDPETKAAIGSLYRECIDWLWSTVYKEQRVTAESDPDTPESAQFLRIIRSVEHAAEHFGEYPLLLFAFDKGDSSGGSIYPAVWNAMLAARAEGVGSSLTTVLGVKAAEVAELLDVPTDEGWAMSCCVPLGYPKGKWGIAQRRPVHEVSYRNKWGQPVGFEVPQPLWSLPVQG